MFKFSVKLLLLCLTVCLIPSRPFKYSLIFFSIIFIFFCIRSVLSEMLLNIIKMVNITRSLRPYMLKN